MAFAVCYAEVSGDNSDTWSDSGLRLAVQRHGTETASGVLTLEAAIGSLIIQGGALTLRAGSGIVLEDSMTGGSSGQQLVLNADSDSNGDGTLTVSATKTVSSGDRKR